VTHTLQKTPTDRFPLMTFQS